MVRLSEPVAGIEIYSIADSATIDQAKAFRIVGFGKDHLGAFGIKSKKTAIVTRLDLSNSDSSSGISFEDLEFGIGDPLVDDSDACRGDSGGPVMVGIGGTYKLAGLISRPVKPSNPVCGDGTICLRLDRYVEWIDDNIKALGGQQRPT